jgi:hypothetical protein
MSMSKLSSEQTRAQETAFVSQCSLASLQKSLPLKWPTPPGLPCSPKKSYRSEYVYPWQAALGDPHQVETWKDLSDFDLLLHLVDFSGLRPVLANLLGWISGRGWEPFDPISFFLLAAWQIANRWERSQTLLHLAEDRYADYAGWFGFRKGVYPTEGGVRYFLTTLGRNSEANSESVAVQQGQEIIRVEVQKLNLLLVEALEVMRQTPVLSPKAWDEALLCPDGQIHDAASNVRCISVTESCYLPCTPGNPRHCPAKDKERRGCDCDRLACVQLCQQATPRDPQARFIWYTGSNQSADNPNHSTRTNATEHESGQARYGYRSLPLRLADPLRRFSVTLLDDVRPANGHEDIPSAALLLQLDSFYPDLHVDAVAGDAGFGFDAFLHTVYATLQARRVIDRRCHQTDHDKNQWATRGYDDYGRPVCQFGFAFNSYGFDRQRQRHKWCCDKVCLQPKPPRIQLPHVSYPPAECPYLADEHLHGRVINVGERFADASIRLVRDIPFGSPTWKALYRRARNAVEGRNATFEDWGFKRMPVFGLARSKALLFLADVLDTLSTLARLIREASLACRLT